jgi:mannose-6-phosphate isomerase-like protein (cupin superfamily)
MEQNTGDLIKQALDCVTYSTEKMKKVNLFETPRMFCDVYCLQPGQSQKVHSHDDADKIYFVLEGRVTVRLGDDEQDCGANMACLAPASVDHGVRNDSPENAVVMAIMAPNPNFK